MSKLHPKRVILIVIYLMCIVSFYGCTEKDGIVRPDEAPDRPSSLLTLRVDHDYDVLQGRFHDLDITLYDCSLSFGGFELLLGFDTDALAFIGAEIGPYFAFCGWEYFSYRYEWNADCGKGHECPSGLIRLIAMAETNDGPNHPDYDCIANGDGEPLITLRFFVSNDRALDCTTQPIRFFWQGCGDNTVTTARGDSLILNGLIIDIDGNSLGPDTLAELPGNSGVPDNPCLKDDRIEVLRGVEYDNGAIDIVCSDSLNGGRIGDINCNGTRFEIADAVVFTNYFMFGLSAFGDYAECSIRASDCNVNGIYLETADLAYLVRIIIGDALPFPDPNPDAFAALSFRYGIVTLESTDDVGVVLLEFNVSGQTATPTLLADDMDIKYVMNGDELRVLIYNIGSGSIPLGQTDILSYQGMAELIDAEVAAYTGYTIPVIGFPAARREYNNDGSTKK